MKISDKNENRHYTISNQHLFPTSNQIPPNPKKSSIPRLKIDMHKIRMIPIPKTKRRYNIKPNTGPKTFREDNNSLNIENNYYENQKALLNFSFGKLDPNSAYSTDKENSSNKKEKFHTKTEEIPKKVNKYIHNIPVPINMHKKENLNKNSRNKKDIDINNITTKVNLEPNLKLIEENFVDNFKNKERSESLKKALKMYNKIKSLGKLPSEKRNERLNNSYTSGFNYNKKYIKTDENNNRQKYFVRKLVTEERYYIDENGKEQLIGIKHSMFSDKENYPLNKIPNNFNNKLIAHRLKRNISQRNNKIKSIPISNNNSSFHSIKYKIPHEKNNLKIQKIEKYSSYKNISNLKNIPINNQIYKKKICEHSKNKDNLIQTKIIKIPNRNKLPFIDAKFLKRNHSYHEIISSSFKTNNTMNTDYLNSDTESHITNYTNCEISKINNLKKVDTEKNSNTVFLSRCSNNSNCSYYESKSLSNNNNAKQKLKNSNSQSNIYNKDTLYNNIGYHENHGNKNYSGNITNNINIVPIKPKYLRRRHNSYSNSGYVTVNLG